MSIYGQNSVLDAMYQKYGQYMPQQAPQRPQSALNDLDMLMRNATVEERRLIEASEGVAHAKSALLTNFLDWLIGATPQGIEFCTGAGANQAQALFDAAKAAHKEAAGRAENEQEEIKRELAELKRKQAEKDEQIAKLCEQLGVDSVGAL